MKNKEYFLLVSLFVVTVYSTTHPDNYRRMDKRRFRPIFPEDIRIEEGANSRMLNTVPVCPGQFPWQVRILYHTDRPGMQTCSGSLISSRWVLTAGHCIVSALNYTLHLGSITTDEEELGRVTIYTDKTILHDNYDSDSLENDIGLIDLGINIGSNDRIRPIRLPSRGEIVYENEQLEISGWGRTYDMDLNPLHRTLSFVKFTSISNSQCSSEYEPIIIFQTTLCAVGIRYGHICQVDSGGGLVKRRNGKAFLVGVACFVRHFLCSEGGPSGFVRTEPYLDWIATHTSLPL